MNSSETPTESRLLDPDTCLMLQVQEDVPGAFEQLIKRFQNRVVGIFFHLIGNREEAEDLAQEVFLRIYRNRKNYEPKAKFSTWLFTIVNNRALNAVRDRKRKPITDWPGNDADAKGARPLEQMLSISSSGLPSRVFAKTELAEIVQVAIRQLPEEQRLAVMLNKFEDLSYREIARIMNRSEMAVKSLLARARQSLRDLLEPYLQNGQLPGPLSNTHTTPDNSQE